jgi:hypothetical protein
MPKMPLIAIPVETEKNHSKYLVDPRMMQNKAFPIFGFSSIGKLTSS